MSATTFHDCIMECAGNSELVQQFNRLSGCEIGIDIRTGLEREIDIVTGYQAEIEKQQQGEYAQFIQFVWDCVWMPLAAKGV